MDFKKFTKLTFKIGFAILLICLILPPIFAHIIAHIIPNNASIGIIGGADGFHSKLATLRISFALIYNKWARLGMYLGLTLIILAIICKFCKNTIIKYTSVKKSLLAILFSFASVLTIVSVFGINFWLFRFNNMFVSLWHIIPLLCISTIIGCIIGIILLIVTIIKYVILAKPDFSYKGLLIDIGFSLIWLPFFYIMFNYVYFLLMI